MVGRSGSGEFAFINEQQASVKIAYRITLFVAKETRATAATVQPMFLFQGVQK
jgi:hypothetical protein